MSTDYITLGPTPADESCQQVGDNYDPNLARNECRRYQAQLQSMLDMQYPDNVLVKLRVKSFPHDFGTYSEVVVEYDTHNAEAIGQALWLESNVPTNWSDPSTTIANPLPDLIVGAYLEYKVFMDTSNRKWISVYSGDRQLVHFLMPSTTYSIEERIVERLEEMFPIVD